MLGPGVTYVPPQTDFTGNERIIESLPPNPTPLDYFRIYFTDSILEHIVTETNRYADQYIASHHIPVHSSVNNWQPTDKNEIFGFLGLSVLMGIVYKPRLMMYWSADPIYHTSVFAETMSRDRYLLILRFLHFVDNNALDVSDPNRDRLYKIRQFVNMIRHRCQAAYSPGRDLCVDESLVLFKGRLAFKQFIRSKRARFGIKVYELCTSAGILLDFIIYHGKMSKELVQDDPSMKFAERVPWTLLQPYLNRGHRVFLDNYYTTPKLALSLLAHGTKLVGTVLHNRVNFCWDLAAVELERGESKFALSDNGVLAVKYRAMQDRSDNKPNVVCLLTTDHANTVAAAAKKDRHDNAIIKPSCILDYNKYMGGVDLMDQQLQALLVIRKTYKWYKKIFFRILLQCMLSAHKLYKFNGGSKDFLNYLHDVVTQLITFAPRRNPKGKGIDSIARLTGRNHFPTKRAYDGQAVAKSSKKNICRVCYARGQRTQKGGNIETTWICEACPTQPGLCLEKGCFKNYHLKFDYTLPSPVPGSATKTPTAVKEVPSGQTNRPLAAMESSTGQPMGRPVVLVKKSDL